MISNFKVGQNVHIWCYICSILVFTIGGCKSGYHIKTINNQLYSVHQGLAPDPAIIEFYRPLKLV